MCKRPRRNYSGEVYLARADKVLQICGSWCNSTSCGCSRMVGRGTWIFNSLWILRFHTDNEVFELSFLRREQIYNLMTKTLSPIQKKIMDFLYEFSESETWYTITSLSEMFTNKTSYKWDWVEYDGIDEDAPKER